MRPSPSRRCWSVAEGGEGIEHFAFQALQVFQGDVEEVAGAAGRVQHAHTAQAVVVVPDQLGGVLQLAFVGQEQGGGWVSCHSARAGVR